VGYFNDLRLFVRATKRLGAFVRAERAGLAKEQARAYSDRLYPPTADDIAFEKRLRDQGFEIPWLSAISLLYPIGAMAYIATRSRAETGTLPTLATTVGYGLSSLGYLLFAAGLFGGKFRVLGLQTRWQVFAMAIVSFVVGTILFNISFP
jgi:hypothetical protein